MMTLNHVLCTHLILCKSFHEINERAHTEKIYERNFTIPLSTKMLCCCFYEIYAIIIKPQCSYFLCLIWAHIVGIWWENFSKNLYKAKIMSGSMGNLVVANLKHTMCGVWQLNQNALFISIFMAIYAISPGLTLSRLY